MTPSELKHTAHHGGDQMPGAEALRTLLTKFSETWDSFNNDEPVPTSHPICVTHSETTKTHGKLIDKFLVSCVKEHPAFECQTQSVMATTRAQRRRNDMKSLGLPCALKNGKKKKQKEEPKPFHLEGFDLKHGLTDMPSIVQTGGIEDPHEGKSKLRFGNNKMEIDPSIPHFKTSKKLPHGKIRHNSVLQPPDNDAQIPVDNEENGECTGPILEEDPNELFPPPEPKVRRSERHKVKKTSWMPKGVLALGLLMLPNHSHAVTGSGIKAFSNDDFLQLSSKCKPMKHSPNLDKLRAHHAACDRWDFLNHPSNPDDFFWTLKDIEKLMVKEPKGCKPNFHFKCVYVNGHKDYFDMETLKLADPYLLIDRAMARG